MAALGHVPVTDHSARRTAAERMQPTCGPGGEVALGGAVQPVHSVVRGAEWLKEASQKAVAGKLGLSWYEIHGIMARAV